MTDPGSARITFRQFDEPDAEEVQAVALAAWQHTYRNTFDQEFIQDFVGRNYAPERLRALVSALQGNEAFFHVALHHTKIVGFCHIGFSPRGVELFRIYLLPSFIGQGIGRTLLDMGERFLKQKAITCYFCYVHKDNELGKQFYLKRGFRHIAANDQGDEWYMEKELVADAAERVTYET